jgi:hypothetical protein
MLLKKWKNNQKGSTGVVAAYILALVVAISLVQNIFVAGQTLAAEEWARTNEHIAIEEIYFDQGYNLIITVTNIGAVDTQLVAVWVEPLDPQKPVRRYSVDLQLEIQETDDVLLPDSGQLLDIFEEFRVTVFTERGNQGYKKYQYRLSPFYDPSVGELGVFRIQWFYNKYASVQNPPDSQGQPVATAVSIDKSEDYITFYVNVTNVWNRPCAIRGDSFLGLPSIAPPQGGGTPNFFIVKNVNYTGTPTIVQDSVFDPIIIYPQETGQLMFAAIDSAAPDHEEWRWGNGYPFGTESTTEGSDIQVSLFFEAYKWSEGAYVPSGRMYGQTISTQATILVAD